MNPIPISQLLEALHWRYATKVFDPAKKIPSDTWVALEQSMVLTPSSYGLQPWKFIVVTDKAIRESLVPHCWKQRQVADCSHLVVMAVQKVLDEAHIDRFISRIVEIRGGSADGLMGYRNVMMNDVVHGERGKWVAEWAARQAYIALGQFMASCALVGVDSCPMEGFVPEKVDELLGLTERGYTAAVLCPAGYRSAADRYAHLPKVRFADSDVIEHI